MGTQHLENYTPTGLYDLSALIGLSGDDRGASTFIYNTICVSLRDLSGSGGASTFICNTICVSLRDLSGGGGASTFIYNTICVSFRDLSGGGGASPFIYNTICVSLLGICLVVGVPPHSEDTRRRYVCECAYGYVLPWEWSITLCSHMIWSWPCT